MRELWMLRLRDGRLRNVTENVVVSGSHAENAPVPDRSPDGERLAFVQVDGRATDPVDGWVRLRSRLQTVAADGTGEKVLDPGVGEPAWAPRGGGRIAGTTTVIEEQLPGCGGTFTVDLATVTPGGLLTDLTATPGAVGGVAGALAGAPVLNAGG